MIKKFLIYIFISCLIYIALFVFLIKKPLTVGIIDEYYKKKEAAIARIQGNKLLLLAGSNGRFSHRCETIQEITGIPSVNMSVEAGMSLTYQLDRLRRYLKSGDMVYLPLEYEYYNRSRREEFSGSEVPYIVEYNPGYLKKMSFEQLMNALFYFDIKFLISGVGEMYLYSRGYQRRYSVKTLTPQGDESTHSVKKAAPYRNYIMNLNWHQPTLNMFNPRAYSVQMLAQFLEWAHQKGIKVVGGLPTTFNDKPVPEELVRALCRFYQKHYQMFVVLPNRSQYPRRMFFDTAYHLCEEYQIEHSRKIALLLKPIFEGKEQITKNCN